MVAAPNTTKEKEGENLETTPQAISDEDKKKVEQDEQNLRTTKEEKTQSQAEQKKEVENKKEELNTPDKNPNALQPVKVKSTSSKEEKPPQTQNEEKIEKALEDTTESADEKKKEKEKKSEKKGIPARFFGGLATISGWLADLTNKVEPDWKSDKFENFPKGIVRWLGTLVRAPARVAQLGLNILWDTFIGLRRLNWKGAYRKTQETRNTFLMKTKKAG